MKIAITGSTGFLGTNLIPVLEAAGHEVVRMVRSGTRAEGIAWDPAAGTLDRDALEGVDAVINLAGRGLGKRRYTTKEKALLWSSRVVGTDLLARGLAAMERKPAVLISASAVGFYGDRGAQILDERSGRGRGFLAELCEAWEGATAPAAMAGVRVVQIRTGIVLGHGGPLFKRLIPAFKLGVGGRLGDGTQYQPWIWLNDQLRAISFLLDADVEGPVNLTAPEPVTNSELVRAIGTAMRRPSFMVVPRFAMAALLGREQVDDLLASQRTLPRRLTEAGFSFDAPALDKALAEIFG